MQAHRVPCRRHSRTTEFPQAVGFPLGPGIEDLSHPRGIPNNEMLFGR
jgi:hypothetical protein